MYQDAKINSNLEYLPPPDLFSDEPDAAEVLEGQYFARNFRSAISNFLSKFRTTSL